jgi:hypothetical protein
MSDRQPWDQASDEPSLWFRHFERYRLLGANRNVLAAYNSLRDEKGKHHVTRPPQTWYNAHKAWDWEKRATAWDAHCLKLAAERIESERVDALTQGFAVKAERIQALNDLAETLLAEVGDEERRWLRDVKSIGAGDNAERVETERFNAPLVHEFRGLLDDIAAEVGGRVSKTDITSGGEKIKGYVVTSVTPDQWDEEDGE